jgi:L-threonylcarbamoyladenylate synthase
VARKKINSATWLDDALEAIRTLRAGGVILHATDTVWGLACDATQPEAVKKLREIKGKDDNSPLLVLVADDGLIQKHIETVPEAAWDLFECSDRPTTVVMPGGRGVAPTILGDESSLGIRRVEDEWSVFVSRGLNRPIVSTSANRTGATTPARFCDIESTIIKDVDFTSKHRTTDNTRVKSSFMVSFDKAGRFSILRQ